MKNTALYARLSRDDGTVSSSYSIVNQLAMLNDFAQRNNFSVYDEYIDDGFSGTNFNRPDFQRLISDIGKGIISNIIVKDLSRLGRDYVMTGFYLERFFPENNVRFVAVNDGIDTDFSDSLELSPFKAVMNDMYARDISRKVRASLDTLKRQGKFIGSSAPYGYKKSLSDKGILEIDENVCDNVRLIFSLFLEYRSFSYIAGYLNKAGIPSPMKYKNNSADNLWNSVTVKNILTNETYAGNITQNKRRKINCKINKRINLDRSQWITIKNTHAPIITYEMFSEVQDIIFKDRRGGF
ncbi:MAG: recombinase family protein [Oscillospiraceae bacterium]